MLKSINYLIDGNYITDNIELCVAASNIQYRNFQTVSNFHDWLNTFAI
jgi:hypothetical protein